MPALIETLSQNRTIACLVVAWAALLLAAPVCVAEDGSTSRVIVTAAELADPGNAAARLRAETPGGLTIKEAEETKFGRASNLEDLLPRTPGVFLQTDNGGEVSKISIRGSGIQSEDEPVGVMILLDGLNYNQGDGEVMPEDINIDALRGAEIFRGAAAFRYGAITLGGAINLLPLTGYDAARFEARLEGGSYGYGRAHLAAGGVQGPADWFASIAARTRDGYRDHSNEDTEIFFGNLGWKLNDHWNNRLFITLDYTSRDVPGGLTKTAMENDPTQADPDALEQNWNKHWTYARIADRLAYRSDELDFSAGAFWFHRDLTERDFFSPEFRAGLEHYYSDNFGGNLHLVARRELFGRRNILTVGVSPQYETEATQNYENLDGRTGATTARGIGSSINAPLYFENQHYLTERFSALLGFQAVYAQRRYRDHFLSDSAGDQSRRQNFFGFNPKVGAIYELNPETQIFANVSRSWQPPTIDNLVEFSEGEDSTVIYTPLRAQKAWSAEIGTRGRRGPVEWELALYGSRLRDELIELNDSEGNEIGTTNVRRSWHRGVEVGLEVELLEALFGRSAKRETPYRLSLEQSYTLNDFHFDGDAVYSDNRLAGIPVHFYEMQLLLETPGGFYAGPNLRCNLSAFPVDQANTLNVDPYTLVGFKIGYRRKKGWSVFVEAKNLTGERYPGSVDAIADARGDEPPQVFHPGDGRSIYGGISWQW